MFNDRLRGLRGWRNDAREAVKAVYVAATGDSNDREIEAGNGLASTVEALEHAIIMALDPSEVLDGIRAAVDEMNSADSERALNAAALAKDLFLDLDELGCAGQLPKEWLTAHESKLAKGEATTAATQASNAPQTIGLNGDGDPVCPACNAVDSIMATTVKTRYKQVRLFDDTVELSELTSMPLVTTYQCRDCIAVVALPTRIVDAA